LRQLDSRGDYTIVADLDEVGKPDSQQLLYRAARELPANVYRHARAGTVRVRLRGGFSVPARAGGHGTGAADPDRRPCGADGRRRRVGFDAGAG
jgi:two-component system NarL family sensor kinase